MHFPQKHYNADEYTFANPLGQAPTCVISYVSAWYLWLRMFWGIWLFMFPETILVAPVMIHRKEAG